MSIAVAVDEHIRVRTFQFIGGREMVKFQSAQAAMNMLRLIMMKSDTLFWPAKPATENPESNRGER